MHRILVYLLPLLLLACDGNAPDSLTNSEVVRDDGWRVSKLTAAGNYGNGVWWMSERLLAAIIAAAP